MIELAWFFGGVFVGVGLGVAGAVAVLMFRLAVSDSKQEEHPKRGVWL
jgi:hypothetical protein